MTANDGTVLRLVLLRMVLLTADSVGAGSDRGEAAALRTGRQ